MLITVLKIIAMDLELSSAAEDRKVFDISEIKSIAQINWLRECVHVLAAEMEVRDGGKCMLKGG